jgi:hypothetical protein
MATFNGPAYAAEALTRLKLADTAHDAEFSVHLRETAATYATLALVAATVGPTYADRDSSEDEQWANALTPPVSLEA